MKFDQNKRELVISPVTKEDEGTTLVEAKLTDEDSKVIMFKFKITVVWDIQEESGTGSEEKSTSKDENSLTS